MGRIVGPNMPCSILSRRASMPRLVRNGDANPREYASVPTRDRGIRLWFLVGGDTNMIDYGVNAWKS